MKVNQYKPHLNRNIIIKYIWIKKMMITSKNFRLLNPGRRNQASHFLYKFKCRRVSKLNMTLMVKSYLIRLYCHDEGRPLHFFLKSCKVYHCKFFKKKADDISIELIWKVPCCPQYNGIELAGKLRNKSLWKKLSEEASQPAVNKIYDQM